MSAAAVVARIYIVRHGETDENRQGIMQGHLDTKLNAAGIEQAEFAANALERVPFQRAFSSDLDRAAKVRHVQHVGRRMARITDATPPVDCGDHTAETPRCAARETSGPARTGAASYPSIMPRSGS